MKLYLTLFAIIFIGFNSAFSQNYNLQFNNALLGQVSGIPNSGVIGTLVVPEGKVWKIETRSVVYLRNSVPDVVYDITVFIGNMIAYSSEYTYNLKVGSMSLPIWLPAGSYPITVRSTYSGDINSFNYSGIEFNLVP